MFDLIETAKLTKQASCELTHVSESYINKALLKVAELLIERKEYLKQENAIDVKNATEKGLKASFIDRLVLTDKIIEAMAEGVKQVADLKSPLGRVEYSYKNELQEILVKKISVPFGVIGIIYESRPNVTIDAFALCFKTANAVFLKGGSDAIRSNTALVELIKQALKECDINPNAVNLVLDTSRETTSQFMKLNKYIDLLIPRGSGALIDAVLNGSTIPAIQTGKGNCNIYVDEYADIDKSVKVIYNAKTQRYGVCNACESLVIHSKVYKEILPKIAQSFLDKAVEMRCDERAYQVIKDYKYVSKASEQDFYEEYDDAIISVKIVDDIKQAVSHINEHSTGHSESIMTENKENANAFLTDIDSACVYHNSSTRFSDGFVFGLGAEIGISTQKLHARGPMGLEALVTTKYVIEGDGAVRK